MVRLDWPDAAGISTLCRHNGQEGLAAGFEGRGTAHGFAEAYIDFKNTRFR
jgi:hypothetical protein